MKLTCPSCQARYTIADEKIAGKSVKIRCKKCSHTIVVHSGEVVSGAASSSAAAANFPEIVSPPSQGDDGPVSIPPEDFASGAASLRASGGDGEWSVSANDDDQRSLTTAQLVEEFTRGTVQLDTYVWKEGMADWVPLSEVPELTRLVAPSVLPSQAAGPLGPSSISSAEAPPTSGLVGPSGGSSSPDAQSQPGSSPGSLDPDRLVFSLPPEPQSSGAVSSVPASASVSAVPAGIASAPPGFPVSAPPPSFAAQTSAPAARRSASRTDAVDLFGSEPPPPPSDGDRDQGHSDPADPGRMVGERNENSVLFSLASLGAQAPAKANASKPDEDSLFGSRSALKNEPDSRGIDDILNLGGGTAPMLAPPPVYAPVVEPVVRANSPSSVSSDGEKAPQKGKAGLIVGVAAAIGLVLAGGFLLGRSQTPDSASASGEKAMTAPAATVEARAQDPAGTAAPSETAAPAETAAAPSATPTAATVAASTPPATTGHATSPAALGNAAEPQAAKNDAPKPEAKQPDKPSSAPAPKAPEAPPSSSDVQREFNRGAATVELGRAASSARSCKKPGGPTGTGKVKVTYAPSGNATTAQVEGPPFAGTPVGGCIAGVFRGTKVPPFDGSPVSVTKSFTIN